MLHLGWKRGKKERLDEKKLKPKLSKANGLGNSGLIGLAAGACWMQQGKLCWLGKTGLTTDTIPLRTLLSLFLLPPHFFTAIFAQIALLIMRVKERVKKGR